MAQCEKCGNSFNPDYLEGLCPHCLLQETLSLMSGEDHPALQIAGASGNSPSIEQLNEEFVGLAFIELLGRGGGGWTYLATQESLSRQVAVKLIYRPKEESENWSIRFRREAEHLAKLNHPLIVTVHDFGTTDQFAYIVMEYVNGPTLREQLHVTKLSEAQIVEIVRQISLAAEYAHAQGLVHRDIKPENILLQSFGDDLAVKVADFGISKIIGSEVRNTHLTSVGQVIGTPLYMAPEQYLPASHIDHRVDIYSIGVLFYELLTGRLPLGHLRAPSKLANCSPQLDSIVFKALSYEPNDRFNSATELLETLGQRNNQLSKGRWLYAGIGLLCFALSVGISVYLFRHNLGMSWPVHPENSAEDASVENPFESDESGSPFHDEEPSQDDSNSKEDPLRTPKVQ